VEAVGQGGNTGALIISGGFTNDGTLTAISGGALYFNSNATIQNNGVISANGAAVAFEGQIGSRRWFYGKRVGGRGNLQPSPRTSRSAFDR